MDATVNWVNGMTFLGASNSGHLVPMDTRIDSGGNNHAPTPMEIVLIGLGGCTAMDGVTILKKSRQEIENCTVRLTAKQRSEPPTVFSEIHLHYVIRGHNLSRTRVENAIDLSANKFCSVSIMIEKTAIISRDFEIIASVTE